MMKRMLHSWNVLIKGKEGRKHEKQHMKYTQSLRSYVKII